MGRSNKKLTLLCKRYNSVICYICSTFMLLIVGSTFLQVFCRKVLNSPLTWSEELSCLAFIWMNCIGSAIAVIEKKHICFSVLTDHILNKKTEQILSVIIDIVIILFFVFSISPTMKLVAKSNSTLSAALQWPSGIFYLAFAVGAVFMIPAYLFDILKIFGIIESEN